MRKTTLSVALFLLVIPTTVMAEKVSSSDILWLESKPNIKALGCSSYEGNLSAERNGVQLTESVFSQNRLFKDSLLTCLLSMNIDDVNKPILFVSERTTINGVNVVTFHADGSSTIGNSDRIAKQWQSRCRKDAMTDKLTCQVYHKNLYVFRDKAGYRISVISTQFPRTSAYIRVGNEKPLEERYGELFSAKQSEKVIRALFSQEKVLTRYTQWPEGLDVDEVIDPDYFPAAMQVLDLIYEKHK